MRLNSKLLIIILFGIILAACQDIPPTPQPQATEPARPITSVSFLPMIFDRGDCPAQSGKAGIAASGNGPGTNGYPIPLQLLCLPEDVIFHRWNCNPYRDDFPAVNGKEWPMVWSYNKNGFPYLDGCFVDFLAEFRAREEREYDGPVLCCNECDRPDQCALDPEGVADLIIGIYRHCPQCRLVGPGYSKADDGQKAAMTWVWVWRKCADLCDTIRTGFYAHQPHHFEDGSGYSLQTRLAVFCDFVEGEIIVVRSDDGEERVQRKPDGIMEPCKHPIIPTVGRLLCNGVPASAFEDDIRYLEAAPQVTRYFVFSHAPANQATACPFDRLATWQGTRATGVSPMGAAFVAGRG